MPIRTFAYLHVCSFARSSSPSSTFQSQIYTLDALTDIRVAFTKSAAPDPVDAGALLTYTLQISNSGAAIHNVVLNDTLPSEVTLVPAFGVLVPAFGVFVSAPGCNYLGAAHQVVCNVGDISTTMLYSLQLFARPWFTLGNGTIISNYAELAYSEGYTSTQQATTIHSEVALAIAKIATPEHVRWGDYVTYTIYVTNVSGNPAPDTLLRDDLPPEVFWISSTAVITGRNPDGSGGTITWTLGEVPPLSATQRTLLVSVATDLPDGYTISNEAHVSSGAAEASTSADIIVDAPRFLAIKEDRSGGAVAPGGTIEYLLYIYNAGHAPATDIIVRDAVPSHTTLVPRWGITATNGIITWTLGQRPPGEVLQRSIQFTLHNPLPPDVTVITNTVTVTCAEGVTATATATTPVTVHPSLTMRLRAAPAATIAPGDYITYHIFYTNPGDVGLTNVAISVNVPIATAFVTATAPFSWASNAARWTWDVVPGAPLPGYTGAVHLVAQVAKPLSATVTQINNAVVIQSAAGLTARETSVHHIKTHPALQFTAARVPTGTLRTGELITYTYDYTNVGDVEVTAVVLTSTIPTNTTLVSVSGNYTVVSRVVKWNIGALPGPPLAGYTGTRRFSARVARPLTVGVPLAITTHAQLSSAAIITTHAVTFVNPVTVQRALSLELISLLTPTVGPGDQIHYHIHYTNPGDVGLGAVVLTTIIPAHTTLQSMDGDYHPPLGIVTWDLGDVPAVPIMGSAGQVNLVVQVDDPLAAAYFITTAATVNSPHGASAQASHTSTISATPVILLEKIVGSVRAVDVVNVIDLSGSMGQDWGGRTKLAVAQEALTTFNDLLNPGQGDQVGLVSFGASRIISGEEKFYWARLESALTGDIETVNAIINSLSPGYFTPLADGTRLGRETVLDPAHRLARNRPVLIIAADGLANVGLDGQYMTDEEAAGLLAIEQAALAKAAGIIVFTIAIGEEFNVEVLRAMASEPPEEHFFTAASPEELNNIYEQIKQLTTLDIVEPGSLISYTLSYANVGNIGLADVVLRDFLPVHTTFVEASQMGVSCAAGDTITDCIAWHLGTVPPLGDPDYAGVITLTLRVDDPVPTGTRWVANTAHIAGHLGGAPTRTVTTPLTLLPYLFIAKSAPATVPHGGIITYTITITNRSYRVLTGTLITDSVPARTNVIDIPCCVLTWTIGELAAEAPGDVVSVSYAVRVDYPLTDGTTILNTHYGATNPHALVVPRTGVITTRVAAPLFAVTKHAAPAPWVREGGLLTYTITIANRGHWTTTQPYTVVDALPSHTSLITAPQATVLVTAIQWHITAPLTPAPAPPYAVTYVVQVASPLTGGLPIVNDSCYLASPETFAPVACSIVTVTVGAGHLLTVTKKITPQNVLAGERLTYTLTYAALGNEPALGVALTDNVPAHTTLYAATPPYSIAGGNIIWHLGDLPFGTRGEVTLSVHVTAPLPNGTIITNAARIAGRDGSYATATTTAIVRSDYELQLSKRSEPSAVEPGDVLTYTLSYTVSGRGIAPDVYINDEIPLGVEFLAASPGASPTTNTGTLSWQLGDLTPPAHGAVTFSVRVTSCGANCQFALPNAMVNTAYLVTADGISDTATVTSVILRPDLAIWKTATPVQAEAGEVITYTLYYQNLCNALKVRGTAQRMESATHSKTNCALAPAVLITDYYAADLLTLLDTSGGAVGEDSVWWELGDVAAGAGGRFTYTAMVAPTLPAGVTEIANRAVITCATLDADVENNAATAQVHIPTSRSSSVYLPLVLKNYPRLPDLVVADVSVEPAAPQAGQPVTITVEIENRGSATVDGPFWVDLYVDPDPARVPPQVNETWVNAGCAQGIAWLVYDLPLAPGKVITLTSHSYAAGWTSWAGWFTSAGTHILYAQVDSYNGTVPYGGVLESDERNNVWGPRAVVVLPDRERR